LGLRTDELGLKLIRQPGENFVLHVEQVGDRFIEAPGPEMRAALRVDEPNGWSARRAKSRGSTQIPRASKPHAVEPAMGDAAMYRLQRET
jgi:hypothetical protein